jgi:uncharacterized protein (DUF427 family)
VGDVYVEPFLRRVRGFIGDDVVVESEGVLLVHRPGRPPAYAFPASDVRRPSEPEPAAPGFVTVAWDAVDRWFEEEDEVFGHPRNPYHRIDILRTTRRLRVVVGDDVLVDTTDTLVLHETSLVPKLYVARPALLEPSPTTTYCPYKGTASWWSVDGVDDVAWSYEDPLPESLPIAGLVSFDGTRCTVVAELPKER